MSVQVDVISFGFLIVVVILVAFLLPTIWQVKKTAREADIFLGELRRELSPTLKNLQVLTEQASQATKKIDGSAEKAENLLKTLDEMALSVTQVSNSLRQDVSRYAELAGHVLVGVKAASKIFSKAKKEKERNL